MSEPYRIYGSELSPYSIKVRSFMRYRDAPHVWLVRTLACMPEFQKLAKLPLIPLVVSPDGDVLQDSTPILDTLDQVLAGPSVHPAPPAAYFVSALLEEYADEWLNKPMFHYRWREAADCESACRRIAWELLGDAGNEDAVRGMAGGLRKRMRGRLAFVGSSDANSGVIEDSLWRAVEGLEHHLAQRLFLFGARPVLADFGVFAQLHQCSTDPTAGARMREQAPAVMAWIERMLEPAALGELEPLEALQPTLAPLVREALETFLPWSAANEAALSRGLEYLEVDLPSGHFTQVPQRYHAKSLGVLRQRWRESSDAPGLRSWLSSLGSIEPLDAR